MHSMLHGLVAHICGQRLVTPEEGSVTWPVQSRSGHPLALLALAVVAVQLQERAYALNLVETLIDTPHKGTVHFIVELDVGVVDTAPNEAGVADGLELGHAGVTMDPLS